MCENMHGKDIGRKLERSIVCLYRYITYQTYTFTIRNSCFAHLAAMEMFAASIGYRIEARKSQNGRYMGAIFSFYNDPASG